ncbi:immunoglobulin-like domain-containing protein [Clostridium tarantellae]|nr:immunoglobulin-like domain-containing protein [Clostridium tarantellae]
MNKNKKRVVVFIFALMFIVFFICFSNEKNSTKIQATPIGNVYFCVDGLVPGSPEFKFYFHREEKVIKIIDVKDGVFLPKAFKDEEFLGIRLYDSSNYNKLSMMLLGGINGSSQGVRVLNNLSFNYRDIIEFDTRYPKNIRIEGNVKGFRGNTVNLGLTKFIINEDSVEIYSLDKPIFSGLDDIKIQQGKVFNPLDGVKAISPIDGDLTSSISVEGSVDINKPGEYLIKYSVVDSLKIMVEHTRKVIVEKPIGRQIFFNIYGEEDSTPEFKLAVDKDNKIIRIVDRKDINFFSGALKNKEYIKLSLFNKKGSKKVSVSLLGNDKGDSSKLNVLDKYSYEDGDYIKFFIKEDEKIKITGETEGLRPYYLRLNDLKFNLTEIGVNVEDTVLGVPLDIEFIGSNIINKGDIFNPLEGVSATNEYGEDCTDKIKVAGYIDVNTPGVYVLAYSVHYDGKASVPISRIIKVDNSISEEEREKLKNLEGIYPIMNLENHKNYFRSMDRRINKFIIKFNKEEKGSNNGRRTKRSE